MADYCLQCSRDLLGVSDNDLAGLSSEEDTKAGRYVAALCEGCGNIMVDHTGKCLGFPFCIRKHEKRSFNY